LGNPAKVAAFSGQRLAQRDRARACWQLEAYAPRDDLLGPPRLGGEIFLIFGYGRAVNIRDIGVNPCPMTIRINTRCPVRDSLPGRARESTCRPRFASWPDRGRPGI